MTKKDLQVLSEDYIEDQELKVQFHDSQPLWIVSTAYQAGFLKHEQLTKNLLSKQLRRALERYQLQGDAYSTGICDIIRELQKELP